MQISPVSATALEDIIATHELETRGVRAENLHSEIRAMRSLAKAFCAGAKDILQRLTDAAMELCNAGSAGISLLDITSGGEVIFRWVILAGELSRYVGGTTPRNFSPCGVVLDRQSPQLFKRQARYFTYFNSAVPEIVEGLVIEIRDSDQSFGTIWIASHCPNRHFDREDVRIMSSLSNFAGIVLSKYLADPSNSQNRSPTALLNDLPKTCPALSSWKEIAQYFGKSVRTVQRWERQYGLPLHSPSRRTGAILAFPTELSDWARSLSIRTARHTQTVRKV